MCSNIPKKMKLRGFKSGDFTGNDATNIMLIMLNFFFLSNGNEAEYIALIIRHNVVNKKRVVPGYDVNSLTKWVGAPDD